MQESKQASVANNAPAHMFGANLYTFKTPRGFFRVLDVIFALITWSLLLDVTGVQNYTEFQFVIGATFIETIYSLFFMVIYAFEDKFAACFDMGAVQSAELICDSIAWLIIAAATIAGLFRCTYRFAVNAVDTGKPLCFWQT